MPGDFQLLSVRNTFYLAVSLYSVYRLFSFKQFIKALRMRQSPKALNNVIFWSGPSEDCEAHVLYKNYCLHMDCPYKKFRFIMDFIDSSQETLDVAIHILTSVNLARKIADVHKRGVTVRVIADRNMFTASSSQIKTLFKFGVPIKYISHEYLMHWKTAIVDKQKLMTGSLNWTLQALQNNWENIVVISQRDVVQQAIDGFELMWNDPCAKLLE